MAGKHDGNPEARLAAVVSQEFQRFLANIDRGKFLSELGLELRGVNHELATIASQNGGRAKGEITVVFALTHEANGVVELRTDMKRKMPKIARGKSVFWTDDDGSLHTRDPKQLELRPREAPPAPEQNREAPPATSQTREPTIAAAPQKEVV